jgi:malate dehydrogenase (quinone)
MMEGREATDRVAATRILTGTDVNFGEITHQLVNSLQKSPQFSLKTSHEVRDIKRNEDGSWSVTLADLKNNGQEKTLRAKYVFIGAGGAGLTLLQKSGIPEVKDYAGFPVGGEFLVSENPDVVKRHLAKVYGKASVGAPPMSVPHLDTRMLDGKQTLLFGPFATFSTKFLKQGSLLDMFGSLTSSNIKPMLHVGLSNFDLVKYLVGQVMLTDDDRLKALQEYFPEARKEDWRLVKAGQRVQIIKKDADKGGVLKLGTEVVTSQDGTISALLGASPGASTAAPIMIDLMAKVFEDRFSSIEWQAKLKTMIPSYGRKLNGNVAATEKELAETSRVLQLEYTPTSAANDEAEEANAAVIGK